MDMEKKYNPEEIEEKIYRLWEEKDFFHVEPDRKKKKYVIVIPPPNITGFLHMGHALNNTIQDILIRWKRMEGYNALWVPGTDHAGIATQNVVERKLLEEGKRRQDLGREKFIEKVWEWKKEFGSRIINQLKKLGASCDWKRLRFTMDENLSKAVRYAFVKLYEKGLIYKGKRIINWCPRCTTALSDEEVEYKDVPSYLYYIRYPLVDGGFIEVATTRPETMLGDTAVAVNPEDERYKSLIGKEIKLPFVERIIPVIADKEVEIEFGTGAVKITPAHDPNDFEIGQRHKLPFVVVIDEEGKMNEMAGKFAGMDRFQARERIIEELKNMGLLGKVEPYTHRVGHCYRCSTPIEPYISTQWFVKMEPLSKQAIRVAEENKLKFFPERWKKVYLNWLYNIKDWCISRQIWWGHRIPVWYCENKNCPPIVSMDEVKECPRCGSKNVKQDEDVLDTWFSSWLWPFSVFGWPEKTEDLEVFYPTDTLVTAQEILFFWVARMVMSGMEFMGEMPFENVFIHGTVRDDTGRKMSKSLGNAIDPVEIIENYGADSLRFSLISMTSFGQDVYLSTTFYIKGRNFMNKIWNASRYIITLNEESNEKIFASGKIDFESLNFSEKWIIIKLNETIKKVSELLERFHFNESINVLYDFFWHTFCDWYIEISKIYKNEKEYFQKSVIPVLNKVLITSLKLLHPFVPFITEKIWQILRNYVSDLDGECVMISKWPEFEEYRDDGIILKMDEIIEIITNIRNIKAKIKIPVSKTIDCFVERETGKVEEKIIKTLGKIEFKRKQDIVKNKNYLVKNLSSGRLFISIEGIIDISKELEKLENERVKLEKLLEKTEKMLSNKNFLEKAKKDVIEKTKQNRIKLEEKIENIKQDINFFKKKGE